MNQTGAGARIRLTLAYDGTGLAGWQAQPGRDTVQSLVEDALGGLYRSSTRIPVTAAGRTDAGVHAEGQVAHFDPPHPIPAAGIVAGANNRLPDPVRILAAGPAPPGFHARFSARAKTYRYRLLTGDPVSPLRARFGWAPGGTLDPKRMAAAAAAFPGAHDFRAFFTAPPGEEPRTPVRTVLAARLSVESDEIRFEVEAEGFLRYMVRRMTGMLVAVGQGRIPVSRIRELLENPETPGPRFRAPARGLCLLSVAYPDG